MSCWAESLVAQGLPPSRAGSLHREPRGGLHICRTTNQLWERACSRLRSNVQHRYRLTHRHREQARSHRKSRGGLHICRTTNQLWERACSRWRSNVQHRYRLTHRLREQARSHRKSGVDFIFMNATNPLWERARSRRARPESSGWHRSRLTHPTGNQRRLPHLRQRRRIPHCPPAIRVAAFFCFGPAGPVVRPQAAHCSKH